MELPESGGKHAISKINKQHGWHVREYEGLQREDDARYLLYVLI